MSPNSRDRRRNFKLASETTATVVPCSSASWSCVCSPTHYRGSNLQSLCFSNPYPCYKRALKVNLKI